MPLHKKSVSILLVLNFKGRRTHDRRKCDIRYDSAMKQSQRLHLRMTERHLRHLLPILDSASAVAEMSASSVSNFHPGKVDEVSSKWNSMSCSS